MKRVKALLVDNLLGFILMCIIVCIMKTFSLREYKIQISCIYVALLYMYYFVCDYIFKGNTIGKRVIGIKVHFKDENVNYFKYALYQL